MLVVRESISQSLKADCGPALDGSSEGFDYGLSPVLKVLAKAWFGESPCFPPGEPSLSPAGLCYPWVWYLYLKEQAAAGLVL